MKRSIILGTVQGLAILVVIVLGVLIAYAADIFTVDKDGIVRLVITDTGNVGIGTTNPSAALEIVRENPISTYMLISSYGAPGNGVNYIGKSARGTISSPTASQDEDAIVSLRGAGHNGSGFTGSKGIIQIKASQNWTSTANGTYFQFLTTENNTTSLQERMRIDHNGNVGIGAADPTSKLHVTGLPEYADNAAALAAGLTAGAFYRTGDLLKIVH